MDIVCDWQTELIDNGHRNHGFITSSDWCIFNVTKLILWT